MGGFCSKFPMRAVTIFQFLSVAQAFDACKEPKLCDCLWDCSVLADKTKFSCEFKYLVVPGLGVYFDTRRFEMRVGQEQEKLEMEEGRSYEGEWKEHVLGFRKSQVIRFSMLTGVMYNLLKSTYKKRISARMKTTPKKNV